MFNSLFGAAIILLSRFIFGIQGINSKCIVKKTYFPSEYEKLWRTKLVYETDSTAGWVHGCELLRNSTLLISEWIKFSNKRLAGANPDPTELMNSGALSYFQTQEICDDKVIHEKKVPIEPLVGFLRHPFYHCFKKKSTRRKVSVESKDYIIPTRFDDVVPISKINNNSSTTYLFDLGANLYDGWQINAEQILPDSMSTKWFVNAYNVTGIEFDRILCWEASYLEPRNIFGHIPRSILQKVSYFNVPVSAEKESEFNPLVILKDLATKADFVAIKIDIDNPVIENLLINQIMSDPILYELIDELYYEHHVGGSPMVHMGWGTGISKNETLIDSYEIFSTLREHGIRAHSWV